MVVGGEFVVLGKVVIEGFEIIVLRVMVVGCDEGKDVYGVVVVVEEFLLLVSDVDYVFGGVNGVYVVIVVKFKMC